MGRKTTKIHFVNADDVKTIKQYLKANQATLAELRYHLPFPLHPQSIYAGLRGDVVTQETKEAIEAAATALREPAKTAPVPVWSNH